MKLYKNGQYVRVCETCGTGMRANPLRTSWICHSCGAYKYAHQWSEEAKTRRSRERDAWIWNRLDSGYSQSDVARSLGVTRQRVSQIVMRLRGRGKAE